MVEHAEVPFHLLEEGEKRNNAGTEHERLTIPLVVSSPMGVMSSDSGVVTNPVVQLPGSGNDAKTSSSSSNSKNMIYLNNAGQARFSLAVQRAGVEAVQRAAWDMHAEDDQARCRGLFAELIHANSTDIAIMPSTAFAVTLAAQNIFRNRRTTIEKGRIVVLQDQMNSAVYPWQHVCEQSQGAWTLDIVPVPTRGKETWTNLILDRISNNKSNSNHPIVACCLPPLHWSDGSLVDLVAVGKACRAAQIPLIVDATQGVGIMEINVAEIQPDMLTCSVHKWLRAPAGTCLVYMNAALHETWQPLDHHGRSRARGSWNPATDHMGPTGYPMPFVEDARKFDSGGTANPLLLPMLRASLEEVVILHRQQQQDVVQRQLQWTLQPLLEWVQRTSSFYCPDEHLYHLIGIRSSDRTAEQMVDLCTKLQTEYQIYAAVRNGALRISIYIDTTVEEIQTLVAALDALSSSKV